MMNDGELPPFCSMVRSSGLAEVWTHNHDDLKFRQFGWRCTNQENEFSKDTLVGNWNEERFDIEEQKKAKPLPSQHEHYFGSTYGANYNKKPIEVPPQLKHFDARQPYAHPAHQPELDPPCLKEIYNSWETTSRAAYIDPKIRYSPVPKLGNNPCSSQLTD
ncbi:hypothetical protein LSH36_492g02002 [Paralvinella palmiformis]|uniref:Uncharacterized protein n=1 Tax=Paralvinella palmiformis TaxID=53620 RepID=A0AAD9J906_9ANNE|nr:hypothetical protein LSH36_492g02002 [Paralvinella palmiformis]